MRRSPWFLPRCPSPRVGITRGTWEVGFLLGAVGVIVLIAGLTNQLFWLLAALVPGAGLAVGVVLHTKQEDAGRRSRNHVFPEPPHRHDEE